MTPRSILRLRRSALHLTLSTLPFACDGDLDPEVEDLALREASELDEDVDALASFPPTPGGYLCPECASLVAWTTDSLDVHVHLRSNHRFRSLRIELTQPHAKPARIPVVPGQPLDARYRLQPGVTIVPIPQVEVWAFKTEYKASADEETAAEVIVEFADVDPTGE